MRRTSCRRRCLPAGEQLESRALLATFQVINTNPNGHGSLEWAITMANESPGPDKITFNIPGDPNQARTIALQTALPVIKGSVVIDGFTQPGSQRQTTAGPKLRIQLDVKGGTRGLEFGTSAKASEVHGLAIYTSKSSSSDSAAIRISETPIKGETPVKIQGNFLGVTAAGLTSTGQLDYGVDVVGQSLNERGEMIGGTEIADRNLISNNRKAGVRLDAKSSSNNVLGNYIGTNLAGDAALGTQPIGVEVDGSENTIGGPDGRNLISGNVRYGIKLTGKLNFVGNNFIGDNSLDNGPVGNGIAGIFIANREKGSRASSNRIGSPFEWNVIVGNNTSRDTQGGGVVMAPGTETTVLQGDSIGVSHQGIPVPNNIQGVLIDNSHSNNLGGTAAGVRNLINGNDGVGVHITGQGAYRNELWNNYIGTNGLSALGNSGDGVLIDKGAVETTIGGNVISGNSGDGVHIFGAEGTKIKNNFIGTDQKGSAAVPNRKAGVLIEHAVSHEGAVPTEVGRSQATDNGGYISEGNVISGNLGAGVILNDSNLTSIEANIIGLSSDQKNALGNKQEGILVQGRSQGNVIGVIHKGIGNVISANDGDGITLTGGSLDTDVRYNAIGTVTARGATAQRGNRGYGVNIINSTRNLIGTPSVGNDVVYNERGNIRVAPLQGGQAYFNAIRGNRMSGGGDAIQLANGANHGIGAPSLASKVVHSGNTVTIAGSLVEKPSTHYSIDFYGLNPDGVWIYLHTYRDPTNAKGVMTFEVDLATVPDDVVTFRATALSDDGDTSVLSNAASVPPLT
jgi:hypothetical protein